MEPALYLPRIRRMNVSPCQNNSEFSSSFRGLHEPDNSSKNVFPPARHLQMALTEFKGHDPRREPCETSFLFIAIFCTGCKSAEFAVDHPATGIHFVAKLIANKPAPALQDTQSSSQPR